MSKKRIQSLDKVLLGTCQQVDSDLEGESDVDGKDEFIRGLFETLLLGTRASNAIPAGAEESVEKVDGQQNLATNDYRYHSSFPEFRSRAKSCGDSVLELIQIFLNHVEPNGEFSITDGLDATDPEVFEGIADVVEHLLEDVDGYLDDASGGGAQKQVAVMRGQLKSIAAAARSTGSKYAAMVANIADVPKPQEAFMHEIDNSRDGAFVPRIHEKPHAVVPLDLSPISYDPVEGQNPDDSAAYFGVYYPHPYETEIRSFFYLQGQLQPPDKDSLEMPCSVEKQPYIWVDTEEGINQLVLYLLGRHGDSDEDDLDGPIWEVAVDLEHHSFRSFQGITCLMQLSTRQKDYIIDTLAVRPYMNRLLVIFADPNIVKVLHGADSDVLWLQRDFGLYIVNMFDTCQAARSLNFPSFSLAHLLKKYCSVNADKKHQLSDWRVRPLSEDMLKYAQLDTHFLLYIYDCLRVDLSKEYAGDMAERGVLDASREVCLRRYEKEIFREDGYSFLVKRQGGPDAVTDVQKRVLEALWDWRDRVARERDESVGYVVGGQVMLRVSQHLPKNVDQLGQCGNPLPPIVREEAAEIIQIVNDAIKGRVHKRGSLPGPSIKLPNFRAISGANGRTIIPSPFSYTPCSQAQLLGVSRGSPSPVTLGSPVPNTEELYRMAGWLTPSNEGPLQAAGLASLAKENQHSDFGGKGGHSLDLGSLEDEGLDDIEITERIREEIAKEPLLCLTADSFCVEGDDEEEPVQSRFHSENEAGILPGEMEGEQEVEDEIPKSMAEIYKISNRNRKKNKEKKKQRENQFAPGEKEFNELGQDGTEESVEKYFQGRKKSKSDQTKDSVSETVDYMESIHWVKPEDRESLLLAYMQEANSANAHSTTGSVGSAGSDHEGQGSGWAGYSRKNSTRADSPTRRSSKPAGSGFSKAQAHSSSPGHRQAGTRDERNSNERGERSLSAKSDRPSGSNDRFRQQQLHSNQESAKVVRAYEYNSSSTSVVGAYNAAFSNKPVTSSSGSLNPYLAPNNSGHSTNKQPQVLQQSFGATKPGSNLGAWRNRPETKDKGKSMTFPSGQQRRGPK